VASNKQQINWKEVKETTGKLLKSATPMRLWIRSKYSATVAYSRQEDKNGTKLVHKKLFLLCTYSYAMLRFFTDYIFIFYGHYVISRLERFV